MPALRFDLTGVYAINPGYPYELDLVFPGNLTGSIVRAQIANNEISEPILQFTVGLPTYDQGTNQTVFPLRISKQRTAVLQPTETELKVYSATLTGFGFDNVLVASGKVAIDRVLEVA